MRLCVIKGLHAAVMTTSFRKLIPFLIPFICSPLTEVLQPSPMVARSPARTATAPPSRTPTATITATSTPTEPPHFASGFGGEFSLEETDAMEKSASPDWWVNSGGWFLERGGVGSTWLGEAPQGSRWREAYRVSNPGDTDGGAHPQNLFRLITRTEWRSPTQQVYFRIADDHFSASPNRGRSNGVLLFSRYRDADDLYYAGLRVDGSAVIKKKSGGTYTTLAEAPWFPGTYDRASSPNLIPHQTWIGLRTVMQVEGNTVTILLYVDPDRSGFWVPVLQAEDSADSPPPAHPGYGGIRTDFMDVEFDDYRVEETLM
jgi:hypothetical protein